LSRLYGFEVLLLDLGELPLLLVFLFFRVLLLGLALCFDVALVVNPLLQALVLAQLEDQL